MKSGLTIFVEANKLYGVFVRGWHGCVNSFSKVKNLKIEFASKRCIKFLICFNLSISGVSF